MSVAAAGRLAMRRMSEVEAEAIEWLWPRRFPLGKLSILAGEPGLGKSMVTLDMAARVSNGSAWPDGGTAPQGSVVMLALEDDVAATIRPRMDAAGADVDRVHIIEGVHRGDDGDTGHFNLGRDMAALENEIVALGDVRLLVVDPLQGYLGDRNANREDEVRAVLTPLVKLAERQRVAVVGVMHLRKAESEQALHRVSGSGAFVALARSVWMVASASERDERLLLAGKMNLCKPAASLRFTIAEPGRLEWLGESDATAGESFAPAKRVIAAPKVQAAMKLITDLLADGPRLVTDIKAAAEEAGISSSSIDRARQRLAVQSVAPDRPGEPWRAALPNEGRIPFRPAA